MLRWVEIPPGKGDPKELVRYDGFLGDVRSAFLKGSSDPHYASLGYRVMVWVHWKEATAFREPDLESAKAAAEAEVRRELDLLGLRVKE